jgi:hypothetical protein
MEEYGNGLRLFWILWRDTQILQYTLGKPKALWLYIGFVATTSARYSNDFFDGKHYVVVSECF